MRVLFMYFPTTATSNPTYITRVYKRLAQHFSSTHDMERTTACGLSTRLYSASLVCDHMLRRASIRWDDSLYPQYASKAARLKTFTAWPHSSGPTPDVLASSGFFSTGNIYIY